VLTAVRRPTSERSLRVVATTKQGECCRQQAKPSCGWWVCSDFGVRKGACTMYYDVGTQVRMYYT
jgi:hypothetical protein